MKKLITFTALCLFVLSAAVIGVEKPWIDMQNCDFCKVFTAEKGLMEHTQMEFHPVANGVAQMTWVDKEYKEAFGRAMSSCMAMSEAMKKGEKHTVCQFCETRGSLMQAGCKMDNFTSRDAMVTVFSSTDPAMVTKMHDWAKKTNEAMAKMAHAE
jgi:hypothetical protein